MGAKSAAIPHSLYLFGGNFKLFVASCYERAAGNRGIGDQLRSFLGKRVTTEIHAMASAFCLHQVRYGVALLLACRRRQSVS